MRVPGSSLARHLPRVSRGTSSFASLSQPNFVKERPTRAPLCSSPPYCLLLPNGATIHGKASWRASKRGLLALRAVRVGVRRPFSSTCEPRGLASCPRHTPSPGHKPEAGSAPPATQSPLNLFVPAGLSHKGPLVPSFHLLVVPVQLERQGRGQGRTVGN